MTVSDVDRVTLGTLPSLMRKIAFWLLVCLTIGYTTGLAFVLHTTGITPTGVTERYRGNQPNDDPDSIAATTTDGPVAFDGAPAEDGGELMFEKSYAEMLNITHTHILSMATFFALTTAIFAMTSIPSRRTKTFLIVEPFVAMVTSFCAMWLMRYVHPTFAYVLMISSASMAICFYVMVTFSLRELTTRRATR